MGKVTEQEIEEIIQAAKNEFPDDPALQQVHAARKLIAREAELAGMSFVQYLKALRKDLELAGNE